VNRLIPIFHRLESSHEVALMSCTARLRVETPRARFALCTIHVPVVGPGRINYRG